LIKKNKSTLTPFHRALEFTSALCESHCLFIKIVFFDKKDRTPVSFILNQIHSCTSTLRIQPQNRLNPCDGLINSVYLRKTISRPYYIIILFWNFDSTHHHAPPLLLKDHRDTIAKCYRPKWAYIFLASTKAALVVLLLFFSIPLPHPLAGLPPLFFGWYNISWKHKTFLIFHSEHNTVVAHIFKVLITQPKTCYWFKVISNLCSTYFRYLFPHKFGNTTIKK
jgi:hypothetical protein